MIQAAFQKLDRYCINRSYKGWDLFDGLNSSLLKHTPFYKVPFLRLAWIQFFKRSPLNFRRIALVPKGFNPKGLGLFASGMLMMNRIDEAEKLLAKLKNMTQSEGGAIASWGYNFPWQARAFYVPIGTPNMVTTVYVANAFLDHFDATGDQDSLELARNSCEFILKKLVLFENRESICFGYIPGEGARVHNANMLGAALLARVYAHLKEAELLEKSRKAMKYSLKALTPDYLWPYGELSHHQFIDNFHTGFNLVALKTWIDCTGEQAWKGKLEKAFEKYLNLFWLKNGCPKYYHDKLYPIDIHCSAQGIVTFLKLAEHHPESHEMAGNIATWAVKNMQNETGYFYYQKTRLYTNKIEYIRWSQAWMFYALSMYLTNGDIDEK